MGGWTSKNGAKTLWFSLSKVSKKLDRIGTSTSSDFRQEKEVERNFDRDVNHDTLVIMHQLVLRQGGMGMAVPPFLIKVESRPS